MSEQITNWLAVTSAITCTCQYKRRNIRIYIYVAYKLAWMRREEMWLGGIGSSFKRVSAGRWERARVGIGRLLKFGVLGVSECLSIHNWLIMTMNSAMLNSAAIPKLSSSGIICKVGGFLQHCIGLHMTNTTNTLHTAHYTLHWMFPTFSSMWTHY